MLHQHCFTTAIPCVHATDLGHGRMAFIHHHQKFVGKEIDQGAWLFPGKPAAEVPTIILNSATRSHLLHKI